MTAISTRSQKYIKNCIKFSIITMIFCASYAKSQQIKSDIINKAISFIYTNVDKSYRSKLDEINFIPDDEKENSYSAIETDGDGKKIKYIYISDKEVLRIVLLSEALYMMNQIKNKEDAGIFMLGYMSYLSHMEYFDRIYNPENYFKLFRDTKIAGMKKLNYDTVFKVAVILEECILIHEVAHHLLDHFFSPEDEITQEKSADNFLVELMIKNKSDPSLCSMPMSVLYFREGLSLRKNPVSTHPSAYERISILDKELKNMEFLINKSMYKITTSAPTIPIDYEKLLSRDTDDYAKDIKMFPLITSYHKIALSNYYGIQAKKSIGEKKSLEKNCYESMKYVVRSADDYESMDLFGIVRASIIYAKMKFSDNICTKKNISISCRYLKKAKDFGSKDAAFFFKQNCEQ